MPLLSPAARIPRVNDFRMNYVFQLVLSALFCAALGAADVLAEGPSQEAVEHYSKGLQLLKNRDFRNAAIEFEKSVASDTSYGDPYYALGKTYRTLNQFDRAVDAFARAAEIGVSSARTQSLIPAQLADVHTKSAVQSFKQKKFREAVAGFQQALAYDSSNVQIIYHLGLCHSALRDTRAAENAFLRALETEPNYVRAHKSLADLYRRQRQFRLAIETYGRAIVADDTHMGAYAGLARAQIAVEDFEGAEATLRDAVKNDPGFSEGFLLLGHTLNQVTRYHEAVEPLRRALELDRDAETHFRLAEAYYGMGEWRKALDSGLAATRARRDFHAAEVVVADSQLKLGRPSEARTWYNRAKQDSRLQDWCLHQLKEIDSQR